MERRAFVSAGLGTACVTAMMAVPASPALAASTEARPLPPLPQYDLLDAFVRMRGRNDGRLVYGWLEAERSTVIDGEITPLCGVIAGTVQQFVRRSETVYEATTLEIAHYTAPGTDEILTQVRMPGTGRVVDVPRYRFGPTRVRFAVDLDEWEEFAPQDQAANAQQFAPKSSVHLIRSIGPARTIGGSVYLRSSEFGRAYSDRSRPPNIFYREWMTWKSAGAALADRQAPSVPAEYSYASLTSWRPWMQMGNVAGHTAENGYGAKALAWDDCPARFLELTRRQHPDVLDDPGRALRQPTA